MITEGAYRAQAVLTACLHSHYPPWAIVRQLIYGIGVVGVTGTRTGFGPGVAPVW